MADGEVTLEIDGVAYGGWKRVSIQRSIETISGAFTVAASERWPGQPQTRPIRPGSAAAIRIGADTVITGHVDEVSTRIDARGHEISFQGRDATGDLVDCAPDLSPGEWLNLTVLDIAHELAKPFGISVRAEADIGDPFEKVALDPGQSAWDLIEELCRYRALLPVSDGLGALVLTRAGSTRAGTALIEGENLRQGSATLSWRDRYQSYAVKGQSQGTDFLGGEAAAGPVGRASDSEVSRHRPKTVIASSAVTAARCMERAQWEATVRAGRAAVVQVTVAGWRQDNGALWPVNSLVSVRSRSLGVNRELLVVELEHALDEGGRRTSLRLMRPDAFARIEEPEPEESGFGFDDL